MSVEVSLRDGESQDSLLKRFQKTIQMEGVLKEAKSHYRFMSKRDTAREKTKNASRRNRRLKGPRT